MGLKVTRMFVPQSKYSKKCPFKMTMKGICVHNTANKASALSEASYMIRNNNAVSFHAVVDDYQVVECIPENRNAFHAGDGRNGNGNRNYYAVEICYSTGDSAKFAQAEKNAAYYIACKLKEHGWGIDKVKKHQDFSGKYCPHKTLDLGWQRFLNLIREYLGQATVPVKPQAPEKPSKPSKPASNKLKVDGSWGCDTTRASQKVYHTPVDGIVSRQPKCNRKYLPKAYTGSWMFYVKAANYRQGSALIKAIQKDLKAKKFYDGEIDGLCGKKTVIAIQKFLNSMGYNLVVDGYMGKKTVMAWQQYINSRL